MAIAKGKANAGQGGKRGHSNQDHWDYTEAIKEAARKQRRLDAKTEIKDGLEEQQKPDRKGGLRSEARDQKSEVIKHILISNR